VRIADLVGMGCGAAMPALEQAHNFLAANPGSTAAIVCTEICSAAFFSNDDKDIVISNTLFADGSAALVLKSTEQIKGFSTVIKPEWRDALRFRTQDGYLKNVLSEDVPEKAAAAVEEAVTRLLERHDFTLDKIDHWIIHAGGEKIIQALQKQFQLNNDAVQSSINVLKNYGNISSPSVLFVLNEEIVRKNPQPGALGIMTSFGAGFTAHAALIEF
jgi:predicted naringenin-chalcone synthase